MRVYYRDAHICVDSYAVSVRGRPYPLCDVDSAWRVGGHAAGRRSVNAALLLVGVGSAQLVIGLLGWWAVAASGMVFVTAAVLLVRAIAGLVIGATALRAVEDIRQFGRRLELWACISGVPKLLFRTDDAIRYGQVCRALARALENRGRPGRVAVASPSARS